MCLFKKKSVKFLFSSFMLVTFVVPVFCETVELDLTAFLKRSLQDQSNLDILAIEENYRSAQQSYIQFLSTYRYDASVSFQNNYSGNMDNTTVASNSSFAFSGSKQIPFLFGKDISFGLSSSFLSKGVLPEDLNPSSYALSLSYSLPITPESIQVSMYRFNKPLMAFEFAKIRYISDIEKVIMDLIKKYLFYQDSEDSFMQAQENYNNQQKLLNLMETNYKLGLVSGLELIKARVSKLREESNMAQYKQSYLNQKQLIFRVLGLAESVDLKLKKNIDFELKLEDLSFYLKRLRYNKDYQILVRNLKDVEMSYLDENRRKIPDIMFSGTHAGNYSYSFAMSIPILDKGASQESFLNSRMRYENSKLAFEKNVEKIHNNIIDQYNKIMQLKETKIILETYYQYAQDEYTIAFKRLYEGSANMEDIKSALNSVESVSRQLLDNKKELLIAIFELRMITGLLIRTEEYVEVL